MELLSFDCSLAGPAAIEAVGVVLVASWLACSAGLVDTFVVMVGGTVADCSGSVGAAVASTTRQAKINTLIAMFV